MDGSSQKDSESVTLGGAPGPLAQWGADEARLRALGQQSLADFSKRYQTELREWHREWQFEALTLDEAAAYSGLAYDTLRKKVAAGEVPNVGRQGRPRIRRYDLPMRAPGSTPVAKNVEAIAGRILHARGQ